jgi:hypothetical protein
LLFRRSIFEPYLVLSPQSQASTIPPPPISDEAKTAEQTALESTEEYQAQYKQAYDEHYQKTYEQYRLQYADQYTTSLAAGGTGLPGDVTQVPDLTATTHASTLLPSVAVGVVPLPLPATTPLLPVTTSEIILPAATAPPTVVAMDVPVLAVPTELAVKTELTPASTLPTVEATVPTIAAMDTTA